MSSATKLEDVYDRLGFGPWPDEQALNAAIRRAAKISADPIENATVSAVRQSLFGFGLVRRAKHGGWEKGALPVPLTAEQKADMARPKTVEWPGPPKVKPVQLTYAQLGDQTRQDIETVLRHHGLIS